MAWLTSTSDLRSLLSDGSTDKLRYRQRVLGLLNGTNKTFKTFEFRRVTNLSSDIGPQVGVYKNGIRQTQVTEVLTDDLVSGEFTVNTSPIDGDVLEATYYSQWFLDSELSNFLRSAANWIGYGDDPSVTPQGLRPAALYFAAQEAYHKLAVRQTEKMSATYMLEEAPENVKASIESYRQLAKDAKEKSEGLRLTFYQRQDQASAPLFASISGAVREVVPKR